jgi:hypothetical protein
MAPNRAISAIPRIRLSRAGQSKESQFKGDLIFCRGQHAKAGSLDSGRQTVSPSARNAAP